MKTYGIVLAVVCVSLALAGCALADGVGAAKADGLSAEAVWVHSGRTSVVIYWRLVDISTEAKGCVEYGLTAKYGKTTAPAAETRWAQFHRISGLEAGKTYHYRAVILDGDKRIEGKDRTFTTNPYAGAVEITVDDAGRPSVAGASGRGKFKAALTLDRPNTTYILTGNVKADTHAIEIAAANITLELDGYTVEYSRKANKQVFGIIVNGPNAKVFGGYIVQGNTGKPYGYSLAGRRNVNGVEIAAMDLSGHRKCTYPLGLFGRTKGKVRIHHNNIHGKIKGVISRHYPGNDLMMIDADASADVEVCDNILSEGVHRAICFRGKAAAERIAIHHNDIRHHQQYVNGYAICGALTGAKIYRNRITSVGRTLHLTSPNVEFYDNWCSTKGHMTRSDLPANSGKWHERMIELHGIKFEGRRVKNCKVHGNFMRIIQPQPDDKWSYVPPTPLNIGAGAHDAMNEIYNNKFIAITTYKKTRHGGYGDTGQWATGIYFVTRAKGKTSGRYYAYIHDNEFISNDLFISSHSRNFGGLNVRIEKNTFRLGENPTDGATVFRWIAPDVQEAVKKGGNTFIGMKP